MFGGRETSGNKEKKNQQISELTTDTNCKQKAVIKENGTGRVRGGEGDTLHVFVKRSPHQELLI